jgi:hypothetical protein
LSLRQTSFKRRNGLREVFGVTLSNPDNWYGSNLWTT